MPRSKIFSAIVGLSLFLSGCAPFAEFQVKDSEFQKFQALPPEGRNITGKIKVTVIEVESIAPICARYNLFAPQPYRNLGLQTVVACAAWSKDAKLCNIYVTPNAPPVVVGHELRHCFEGSFH